MDLENYSDAEVEQIRKDTLAEQDRRDKMRRGLNRIGALIRDYCDAADVGEVEDLTDYDIGRDAIYQITGEQPPEAPDSWDDTEGQ